MPEIHEVDPKELRLPPSRVQGADPGKLSLQISRFGRSRIGMPRPWVYEAADGLFVLYDGVTRATRIAKLLPGTKIEVEVIGRLPLDGAAMPSVGARLP